MGRYKWRSQYWYNENASQFHESVRQIFINEMPFKNLHCYQEVPVVDLVPDYQEPSHRFDWYIAQLDIILELHGAQHYRPVNFGKIGMDDLIVQFRDIKYRDACKANSAIDAGYDYVAVPYGMQSGLNAERLLLHIQGEKK